MSQFSANESGRDTKNVYFFKSGDHSFGGVKVPVNLRKHRNLDALLDDLSRRVPLSHGVRQLRTPHGRTLITDLNQLEHMGGYVCSEKLNTTKSVPGVDFKKIKGLKDFQYQQSRIPLPAQPESPKKKVKKKSKKKKKVKNTDEVKEENNNISATTSNLAELEPNEPKLTSMRDEISAEEEEEADESGLNDSNLAETIALETLEERAEQEQLEEQYENEIDEDAHELENQNAKNKVSYSAPGTPSESRRLETASLSPLDDKKIVHMQRRRISSKQINVEEYTLPDAKTSNSMKSVFSMRSVDEDDKIIRSKPPKSKPASASSNRSFDEGKIDELKQSSQIQRTESIFSVQQNTKAFASK